MVYRMGVNKNEIDVLKIISNCILFIFNIKNNRYIISYLIRESSIQSYSIQYDISISIGFIKINYY